MKDMDVMAKRPRAVPVRATFKVNKLAKHPDRAPLVPLSGFRKQLASFWPAPFRTVFEFSFLHQQHNATKRWVNSLIT